MNPRQIQLSAAGQALSLIYTPPRATFHEKSGLEHREDYPGEWAAITAVSKRLGMNVETLRNWICKQQVDDGQRYGVTSEAAAEIKALKRRNAELEQTNEIPNTATPFFVRESDPHSRR